MSLNQQHLLEPTQPRQPSTPPSPPITDKLRRTRWAFLILLVLFIGCVTAIVVMAINNHSKQGEIDQLNRQIDDMNTKQNDLYFRKQLKFDAMKVKYFAVRVGNGTQEIMRGLPQIVSLDLSGNDIAQFENNTLPDLQTLNLKSNPIVSFSGNSMDALTNIDADFFKIVRFNDNFLPKIADLRFEPQSEFCGNTMATLSQLTINTALLSKNSLPSLTTVDIYIVGEFGSNALTVSRQFRIKNVKVFKNNTINAEWVPIELQSAGIEIFEDNTFAGVMTLLLMNNSIKAFERNSFNCKKQTEYNFLQGNPLQSFSGNTLSGFNTLRFDSPIHFFNGNNLLDTQNLTLVGPLQTFNNNTFIIYSLSLSNRSLSSFQNNTSPLHRLILSNNNLQSSTFTNNNFPNITLIDLSFNNFSGFPELPPNIRSADLTGNKISQVMRDAFERTPRLNALYLANNQLTKWEVYPSLIEVLMLQFNKISVFNISNVNFPNLALLNVSNNQLTSFNIQLYTTGTSPVIDLSSNPFQTLVSCSCACSSIYMNQLTMLQSISSCVFNIRTIFVLSAPNLQTIDSCHFQLTLYEWKLPNLKSFTKNLIDTTEFTLTQTLITEFSENSFLGVVKLNVSMNRLERLGTIGNAGALREIYLNGNLLKDQQARFLVTQLPGEVEVVDLRDNQIQDKEATMEFMKSVLPNADIRL